MPSAQSRDWFRITYTAVRDNSQIYGACLIDHLVQYNALCATSQNAQPSERSGKILEGVSTHGNFCTKKMVKQQMPDAEEDTRKMSGRYCFDISATCLGVGSVLRMRCSHHATRTSNNIVRDSSPDSSLRSVTASKIVCRLTWQGSVTCDVPQRRIAHMAITRAIRTRGLLSNANPGSTHRAHPEVTLGPVSLFPRICVKSTSSLVEFIAY